MFERLQVVRDAEEEAAQLASLYDDLSQALDDFRLDDQIRRNTSREHLAGLKFLSQKLNEQVNALTEESVHATLLRVQPELAIIRTAAGNAKVQLGTLHDVQKVLAIATAALGTGVAIASGNAEAIAAAADAFDREAAL